MGNLFGVRRRVPLVTAQDRAILQLKQQRDKIRIYQKRTGIDLEKNKELALKLFQNGMKDRALVVLRRKKNMQDILNRTDKQLETLEQLVSDIEYTEIEVSVVEGLKVGTEALKQLNNLMNIDDIQQMMEDNEEAAEKQREISNILQRTSERYDEDDLLKELETYKSKQEIGQQEIESGDKENTVVDSSEAVEIITAPKPKVVTKEREQEQEHQQTVESRIEDLPNVPDDLPSKTKKVRQETRQLESAS